uniref:TPR_REGION domain-containing protein n=1 Tax=Angiostrongylus cantonensis TaxID=6313 RepID=A0A0K0CW05_ANGCA
MCKKGRQIDVLRQEVHEEMMFSTLRPTDLNRLSKMRDCLGRKHALDGHEQNPTSIAFLKILCSTTGRLAEESGVIDKINLGFKFKTYLDRAIAVDPSSLELLHMRGRFSYQVQISGKTEKAEYTNGLSEKIRPGVTENRLYIGRVLYAKGDYTAAKKWLAKAASATCDDDESVEHEHITAAQEMLRLKVFQQ